MPVEELPSASPVNTACLCGRVKGFTLIEVMIVVAIVAVLAAIALPNYSDYIKRGKIIEATSALSDARTRFNQFFLDHRTYVGGCDPPPAGGDIQALAQAGTTSFVIACSNLSGSTFTVTATGDPAHGMTNFGYTIDQANNKVTTGVDPTWSAPQGCGWVTRKDGSCS